MLVDFVVVVLIDLFVVVFDGVAVKVRPVVVVVGVVPVELLDSATANGSEVVTFVVVVRDSVVLL